MNSSASEKIYSIFLKQQKAVERKYNSPFALLRYAQLHIRMPTEFISFA